MEKTFINKIKNVMMKMMKNCKQATYLIDTEQYAPLSIKNKFDLKLHLMTCKFCRLYKVESHLINNKLSQVFKFDNVELKLSDEQKQKLIDKLKLDDK